ncbi:cell surface glycoprotein CD200 receptor 1 [Tiliqua scincoides]|uniref:cell surface glycoprotein CD200 receptor 1 n=1 Tax=Tiliqua scincoides TaxID=71010 RepID=UPI0034623A32
MEAKTALHFAMKGWDVYILLALAVVMATNGSFPERRSRESDALQHHVNSSFDTAKGTKATTLLAEHHFRRSEVIGTEIKLDCPQWTNRLITWTATFRNGKYCYLSYMSSSNVSVSNCSKNVNWVSRPDQEFALHIKPLQISSEGIYKCSIATSLGTFSHEHDLTVLVPPKVSLTYHDDNGTAECKAAAGKPAAKISWMPQGEYKTENETLPNGTETIISIYNITSVKDNNVTCFISHLAWNEPHILDLSSGRKSEARKSSTVIILSGLAGLFGILLLLLLTYLGTLLFRRLRDVNTSKSPETTSRPSTQENELEPYATFVQMENVIYDKACDFSVGEQHFPAGFSLST